MDKEEVIKLISDRISDEHRKHVHSTWMNIAARKIYTQWFEYYQKEIDELKSKKLVKCSSCGNKVEMVSLGECCPKCYC